MDVFGATFAIGTCVYLCAVWADLIDDNSGAVFAYALLLTAVALCCCAFRIRQVLEVSGRNNTVVQVGKVWVD